MRKYVIAAALIFGFAAPALADEIYVILDMTTQKCTTMRTLPKDMKNYKTWVITRRLEKQKPLCTQ